MKCFVSAGLRVSKPVGEASSKTRKKIGQADGRDGRTVGDIAAKVLADDDVPGGAVAAVELLLDLCGDVLLDVVQLRTSKARQFRAPT